MKGFDAKSREALCRLTFSGILLSLAYGWYARVSLHQMEAPVLRYPFLDPLYWLAHLLSVPESITSNFIVAISADCTLLFAAVLAVFFPGKRFPAIIFFSVYLLYFISFNSFGGHHTSSKVGVLLLPIPFMFGQKRFALIWEGMRYYLLVILTSAFCWKLFRLSWLNPQQAETILKRNLAPYLFFNPETKLAEVYRFLLNSPALMQASYLTGFILEGSFIAGFFTKRFDKMLVIIFILLVLGFWFFADAFFGELLLFILPFYPAASETRRAERNADFPSDGAIFP